MTVSTIALAVIALCMVVFAMIGFLLFKKISKTLIVAERTMSDLNPKVARFLDEASGEMKELRGLTERASAVTDDIRAVSGGLRKGAEIVQVARRSSALWAGARAGLAVLLKSSSRTDGKGDPHESQD